MQCSELDRYLEAFLDGRLGRSRGAVMRRHVATCLVCRTRIEKLRQFERELGRRFRAIERCEPVWSALQIDLVRSATHPAPLPEPPALRALPPPREHGRLPPLPPGPAASRPRHRPRARRSLLGPLAGVVLVAAAMGTVYQLGMALLSHGADGSVALAPSGFFADGQAPDYVSGDAELLRRWFAERTGTDFPMPPEPEGFSLLGGRIGSAAEGQAAVLLYGSGDVTTTLYMRPQGSAPAAGLQQPGLTHVRWEGPRFLYDVASPLPAEELRPFEALLPADS